MAERKRKANRKDTTQLVTTGTTIRIEQPKSSRQPKPKVSVIVAKETAAATGFINFLREHAVVSLAVGFAIATQAQTLIKQLITSFIDPAWALVFNGQKLSAKQSIIHWHGREQPFAWGAFAYALLDFIFVLLAIYFLIKLFNLDKLEKPKAKK
jgi:large-conductance mechanosensitive channel